MKNPVKVSAVKHPTCPWRVRYPEGDKIKQKWFKIETEALAFAKEREAELGINGSKFGVMEDDERAAIACWRTFIAGASGTPPELVTVVREFVGRWKQQAASVTLQEAYKLFLEQQDGEQASDRHVASLKSRVGRLVTDKGAEMVSSIDAGTFSDWLNGLRATRADKAGEKLGMVTRDNLKKSCRTFFAYCIERGWTSTNPVPVSSKKRTRGHRLANRKAPAIMMPADVAKFLHMVEAIAPKILPFWCMKFFAGIRDSEAAQLDWAMVDMEAGKINLPAAITKTADPRTVKIEPVLREWLAPYAQKSGPLAPETMVARRFAYKKVLKRLRAPLEKGGKPREFTFPSNAARHSFGTFHLYHFRNAGETAIQLGHKGSTTLLHEHYANPLAEVHAAEFWNIRPAKATAENIVNIKKGRKTA